MPQLRVKFLFSLLEDEKHVTQKYRQGEGCFQHNLGFNDSRATSWWPPCLLQRCIESVNEQAFQHLLISGLYIYLQFEIFILYMYT